MVNKKLNLDQTIFEFGRKLKAHIGSNDTAHLPVSDDVNGFMTAVEHRQVQQIFNGRIGLDEETDILTLAPGFYVGYKLINHPGAITSDTPATWIAEVNVTSANDGRKLIEVIDNFTGYRWYRTIHTGGDISTGTGGWVRQEGEVTLWSGYSKLTSAVTLDQPLVSDTGSSYYIKIRVYYTTDYGQTGYAEGTNKRVIIDCTNLNDDVNIPSPDMLEADLEFPTTSTARVVRNKRTNFYRSHTDTIAHIKAESGAINITKIVGVK
ncbi:hypothetical protein DT351_03410 [Latilactobacillus curvatus]|uniref:Uncharacterized protein n=1 Tax=Latilactobacillus curvatus TaxID=28038 RepID=A0A385ACT0_LATCU|nr:hypothetical protein [Latilactobacillus curvatus]AXN35457.1 hypothetical protein DT351_03410 [Latilactobacillus curvatus]